MFMQVTVVVITKNRPLEVKRLVDSILNSKITSISLVLIDDSTRGNFESIENFLLPYRGIYKHKSSSEVRKEVKSLLKRTGFTKAQRLSIETCFGLKEPFLEFAKSLSNLNPFRKSFSRILSRSFSPYSTARNLGMYYAYRVFKPEKIVFLDDDCVIKKPERLMGALQLIGKKVDGKEIVAVSGLYENLSISTRKRRHLYEEVTPTSIVVGMNSFLKRSFLTQQQQRLILMPYHALGGALILSRKIFTSLPFDPFVPRGEDHAYCVDFKARHGKDFAIVRDNLFVVHHNLHTEEIRDFQEINVLRDIFRFVYLRFKVGQWFIPGFALRWALNALIHMYIDLSKSKQRLLELWALLFLARIYAKKNVGKYSEVVKAWKSFIEKIDI